MAITKVVATDTVEEAFLNKLNPAIDEIVVNISRAGAVLTLTKEGGGTIPANLLNTAKGVITGLQITKGVNNLTFDVTGGDYSILDIQYNSAGGSFAVSPGDSTDDRLDIIVANTAGDIVIKTGTPAPAPSAPAVVATELLLATVLVKANATVGSSGDVLIYLQNPQKTGGVFIDSNDLAEVIEGGAAVSVAMSDLTDVDLTGLVDGDKLIYAAGTWVVKKDTLEALDDTSIAAPAADEILKYNSGLGKWQNTDQLGAIKLGDNIALTSVISPPSFNSNQDDYNPTGLSTANIIRLTSTGNRDITGIVAQRAGTTIILINVGGSTITLENNDSSSSASNRFLMGQDRDISPNEAVMIWYDSNSSRWRVLTGVN